VHPIGPTSLENEWVLRPHRHRGWGCRHGHSAPAVSGIAPPRRPPWPTRDRLGLRRCVGYRADGPQGRVGTVEDVRIGWPHGEPEYILIRTGQVSGEQLSCCSTTWSVSIRMPGGCTCGDSPTSIWRLLTRFA